MKTKICVKCMIKKLSNEFTKDSRHSDGLQAQCKECRSKYYYKKNKNWRRINPEYKKNWLKDNPNYNKQYSIDNPWQSTLAGINSRCYHKENGSYKSYGGKGIKNYLNMADLKYLWFRDKAYLMDEPSIDRLNNKKDYILENCRYLELDDNRRKKRKV
jgi:hypothetical protein